MPVTDGPDPTDPDRNFRDAEGRWICVRVLPYSCPICLTYDPHWDLEDALVGALVTHARRWWRRTIRKDVDERFRVAVSRRPRRAGPWRTLSIEFFDDEAAAEARQVEILRTWDDEYWSTVPPVGIRERERLRRASRRAEA